MARGSKASYTDKQKRQASDIEKSYEDRGVSSKTAAARAWATVNKQTGGGLKKKSAAKKAGTSKKTASRKSASKKSASKKSASKKSASRRR